VVRGDVDLDPLPQEKVGVNQESMTYEGDSRKAAVIMYPGRDTPSPFKINSLVNFSHGGNTVVEVYMEKMNIITVLK